MSWGRKSGGAEAGNATREAMAQRRGRMWRNVFADGGPGPEWTPAARAAAQTWAEAPQLALVHFPEGSKRRCLCGGDGDAPGGALAFAECAREAAGGGYAQSGQLAVFAAIAHTLTAEDVLTFAEHYHPKTYLETE